MAHQKREISFIIDTAPVCEVIDSHVQQVSKDENEVRSYMLLDQSKERVTQQNNIIQKIGKVLIGKPISVPQSEDESEEVFQINRYFTSEVNNFDNMTKGLCRRCKKPGHFEKWCLEEAPEEVIVCRFCLGPHYHLRCPNSLCYKCNELGHMSKDCKIEGVKCRSCGKRGHKSRDCYVLDLNDPDLRKVDNDSLRKILCLGCHQRGHLNCLKIYSKLSKNHGKDDLYSRDFQRIFEEPSKKVKREEKAKNKIKIEPWSESEEQQPYKNKQKRY